MRCREAFSLLVVFVEWIPSCRSALLEPEPLAYCQRGAGSEGAIQRDRLCYLCGLSINVEGMRILQGGCSAPQQNTQMELHATSQVSTRQQDEWSSHEWDFCSDRQVQITREV